MSRTRTSAARRLLSKRPARPDSMSSAFETALTDRALLANIGEGLRKWAQRPWRVRHPDIRFPWRRGGVYQDAAQGPRRRRGHDLERFRRHCGGTPVRSRDQTTDQTGVSSIGDSDFYLGETLSQEHVADIRNGLLAWFDSNRRDLPWRRTRDPYRILISEVMLQQTQVDRVIPYYERFLELLPTVEALADAPTSLVITLWAGLGYNRRAVNLQRTAQAVMEQHGGVFPTDTAQLLQLPGIGPYTAGAIACFAFEQPVAFLDTNMKRVIHRLIEGPDLPRQSRSDRELLRLRSATPASRRRLALESGAHRIRRSAVHSSQACMCHLSTAGTLRRLSCDSERHRHASCRITQETGSSVCRFEPLLPRQDRRRIARRRGRAGVVAASLDRWCVADYAEEHAEWLLKLVRDLERDGLAKNR